jgi:phosphatidate cytidylyltransferase
MQAALRNRLIFGPIMLLILLALLAVDHWVQLLWGIKGVGIALLMLLVLPAATFELANLFATKRVGPYKSIASPGSALLVIHAFLTQFHWMEPVAASTLAFIIVFVMIFAAVRLAYFHQTQEAIGHMAGTVLSTLYLGGQAWFLMALRVKTSARTGFEGSTAVILMILLVVKFTDIGAFFGGKLFGRHKLIPWLSPGKTWEGLICGVCVAGVVGLACAPQVSHLTWPKGIIFGAIIGLVGQGGDLLESLMKRDAEVKDSGQLIPGFGGVLDVIDSPLLASPFAYMLFSLF